MLVLTPHIFFYRCLVMFDDVAAKEACSHEGVEQAHIPINTERLRQLNQSFLSGVLL